MDEEESIDYAQLFGLDPAAEAGDDQPQTEGGANEEARQEQETDRDPAAEEGGTQGEGTDEPEEEDQPAEPLDAEIRRRAEQERDAAIAQARAEAQQELDAFVAGMGINNPYTNTPIKTKSEYDAYQRQHADHQREQFMQANGMSQEQYDQFVQSLPEVQRANQTVQAARAAQEQAQAQQAKAALDAEIAKISELDPAISSIDDLMGSDYYDRIYDLVKGGYHLADAYKIVNFDRLTQRAAAASSQQTRNQAMGKRHLGKTQTRGDGAVEVPQSIKQAYRDLMPHATDAEIRENYARYLKSNERRN